MFTLQTFEFTTIIIETDTLRYLDAEKQLFELIAYSSEHDISKLNTSLVDKSFLLKRPSGTPVAIHLFPRHAIQVER